MNMFRLRASWRLVGVKRSRFLSTDAGGGREAAKQMAAERKRRLEEIVNKQKASTRKKVNVVGSSLAVATAGCIAAGCWFGFTEQGNKWFNENIMDTNTTTGKLIESARNKISEVFRPFTAPSRDQLLPDMPPVPPGHVPFRTLVLDLEGTLVHSEWDRRYGWRTAKRPGVDKFLYRMAGMYEIVLFSSGQMMFDQPIAAELDQFGCISHYLFRSATTFESNQHIKDISKLGRDLARVVVIDDETVGLQKQPENLVLIKPYTDVTSPDTTLDDLALFLEDLVVRDVKDVRAEIAKYKGTDIVEKFKVRAIQQKQQEEQQRSRGLGGFIRGRR